MVILAQHDVSLDGTGVNRCIKTNNLGRKAIGLNRGPSIRWNRSPLPNGIGQVRGPAGPVKGHGDNGPSFRHREIAGLCAHLRRREGHDDMAGRSGRE